ncbi:terminase [Pseudomonas argentinensis]|uniref:Phage small terminase subunit n=1 Tax=Phytopseudomonas argentinensis TaxID=289370 RepID=A0A1I3I5T2_9GAMM|nr:phage terminase small subunit [Pseudomonas argentinensis]KAB0547907.1 terminase [Pseudomonas argentinensis]SFI43354.1 Phage small terminase subunit [Pseudomonas argentinensis]
MALSPAKRHFQQATAAIEAAAVQGPALTMEGATAYELMQAQLHQHKQQLKKIQSQEGKAETKRKLLPDYAPYAEGVLSAGKGAQDDVLTTIMLWRIDVGDYAGALDIAEYALAYGLTMPDSFERSLGCVVAEEIANVAIKMQKASGSFDLGLLLRTEAATANEDMPDEARAKLHLAIGKAASALVPDDAEAADALPLLLMAKQDLARAIELHTNCGGKKDLERVERLLKKHAGTTG